MDLVHQRTVFYSVGSAIVVCIGKRATHLVVESVNQEDAREDTTEETEEDSW